MKPKTLTTNPIEVYNLTLTVNIIDTFYKKYMDNSLNNLGENLAWELQVHRGEQQNAEQCRVEDETRLQTWENIWKS